MKQKIIKGLTEAEYLKAYREANKDKIAEYLKAYREANKYIKKNREEMQRNMSPEELLKSIGYYDDGGNSETELPSDSLKSDG